MHSIPATYEANKKAWMMLQLFKQWLHAFDTKVGWQNRKIVLFMDHYPAHPAIKLRNNESVFLPPNTSMLQPLDQGVFQFMKHHFQSMLENYLLKRLETRNDVMKWNVLDAICTITVSWERITLETIAACFRHIGFHSNPISAEQYHRPQELHEPEGWRSVTEKLEVTCPFAEYIAADETVDVCSEVTD
jgi:hypothetical protein